MHNLELYCLVSHYLWNLKNICLNQEILVPIRRDGNISHLVISLTTQRSMGESMVLLYGLLPYTCNRFCKVSQWFCYSLLFRTTWLTYENLYIVNSIHISVMQLFLCYNNISNNCTNISTSPFIIHDWI